jgi:hypothetical protein
MPTIKAHYGYEILIGALRRQETVNSCGQRPIDFVRFFEWLSASEIVRFDGYLGLWGIGKGVPLPVNWRARGCFLLASIGAEVS